MSSRERGGEVEEKSTHVAAVGHSDRDAGRHINYTHKRYRKSITPNEVTWPPSIIHIEYLNLPSDSGWLWGLSETPALHHLRRMNNNEGEWKRRAEDDRGKSTKDAVQKRGNWKGVRGENKWRVKTDAYAKETRTRDRTKGKQRSGGEGRRRSAAPVGIHADLISAGGRRCPSGRTSLMPGWRPGWTPQAGREETPDWEAEKHIKLLFMCFWEEAHCKRKSTEWHWNRLEMSDINRRYWNSNIISEIRGFFFSFFDNRHFPPYAHIICQNLQLLLSLKMSTYQKCDVT